MRRQMQRQTWVVVGLMLAMAAQLAAQEGPRPARRAGPFVRIGGALSRPALHCDANCASGERHTKYAPTLALGWALTDRVAVGLDGTAWFGRDGGLDESFWAGLLTATFYPLRHAGLYLDAGAGLSRYALSADARVGPSEALRGPAVVVRGGVGYDLPLGRHLALTPAVSYSRTIGAFGGDWGDQRAFYGPLNLSALEARLALTVR